MFNKYKKKYEALIYEIGKEDGLVCGKIKFWEEKAEGYDPNDLHYKECMDEIYAEKRAWYSINRIKLFIAKQDKWGA